MWELESNYATSLKHLRIIKLTIIMVNGGITRGLEFRLTSANPKRWKNIRRGYVDWFCDLLFQLKERGVKWSRATAWRSSCEDEKRCLRELNGVVTIPSLQPHVREKNLSGGTVRF